MAQTKLHFLVPVLVLMAMAVEAARTPPGIAKNPSNARCMDARYKTCHNLVHVCPKFCPDQCTVNCVSCKPVCGPASNPPTSPSPSTPNPPSTPTPTPTPPTPPTTSPSSPYPPTPSTPSPTPPTPTPSTPSPTPPTPTPSTPSTPTPSSTPSTPSPTPPTPTPSSPSPTPPTPTLSTPPPTPHTPTPSTPSPTPPTPTPSTPSPSPPTPSPTPPTSTPSTPSPTPSTPSPTPPTPTPSTPSPTPPTPTPSTPSPSSEGAGYKRVRCKNKNYPQCYNLEHVCPSTCPGGCEVDCVTCKPVCKCDQPGAVCQDPRFIGGDGITFYFHGKKNQNFCLLSDNNLHINAHFIGNRNSSMKRDFTWVQSIGILFGKHQLYVGAIKTATWDDAVDRLAINFDGEPITLSETQGTEWQSTTSPSVLLVRDADTNSVTVEVEDNFKITAKVVPITQQDSRIHKYGITADDSFAHLDLRFKFFALSNQVSGVLGQTYRPGYMSRVKIGEKMPVMGGDKEFGTSSLFSTDCAVARFEGRSHGYGGEGSLEALELPRLNCVSGLGGQGVVCKK